MAANINEQQLLAALHRIPEHRWGEVLQYLEGMQAVRATVSAALPPIHTGTDLRQSELIGIWAERTDLGESREFARRLRHQASHRGAGGDVAGH
jgi:hypothetical protein